MCRHLWSLFGASACLDNLVVMGMHAMLCRLNAALAECDSMVLAEEVLKLAVLNLQAEHEVVPPIQAQALLRAVSPVHMCGSSRSANMLCSSAVHLCR